MEPKFWIDNKIVDKMVEFLVFFIIRIALLSEIKFRSYEILTELLPSNL